MMGIQFRTTLLATTTFATTRLAILVVIFLLGLALPQSGLVGVSAQSAPSGCERCAASAGGDCQEAFEGHPGQFCGTFFSAVQQTANPCCCPVQATCKLSTNNCLCHVSDDGNNHNQNNHHNQDNNHNHNNGGDSRSPNPASGSASAVVPILLFLLTACCFVTSCMGANCGSSNNNRSAGDYPYQKIPVAVAQEIDPMAPPPSINPNFQQQQQQYHSYGATAPTEPIVSSNVGVGTSSSAGGGWMSGLGGFAAGTILGSAATHQWDRNHQNQNSSGGGDGGGYDFSGDTGDVSGGGYDILGDTGDGGGYDIMGDS